MEGQITIKNFTDLSAWQKNHEFVKRVYLVTKKFPREEQFGLTSQLRRAASSITANIAEGFGRYYFKDKIRFYYQARGSNTECENHLILAFDLAYISEPEFRTMHKMVTEGNKIICGLISSIESNIRTP